MSESGAAAAGSLEALRHRARLLDRINPVTLRALREGLRSRAFVVGSVLVLLGLLGAAAGLAASGGPRAEVPPIVVATGGLAVLLAILVPIRAFEAMASEMDATRRDHLLLTRLRPRHVALGHLGSSLLLQLAITGTFLPLFALAYLLGGATLEATAYVTAVAVLVPFTASALATAMGALARGPRLRRGLQGLLALLVAAAAVTAADRIYWIFRAARFGLLGSAIAEVGAGLLLACAALSSLALLIASAALAHPFENRSTGFRLHGIAVAALVLGLIGVKGSHGGEFAALALLAGGYLSLLALFATTEAPQLTPRQRAQVPRSRLLALAGAPLLPGAARGVLYAVLSLGALVAAAIALHPAPTPGGAAFHKELVVLANALPYLLFYPLLGHAIRRRLGAGSRANWIARGATLVVAVLGFVAPVLFDLVVTGRVDSWHMGHLLDFAWTLEEYGARWPPSVPLQAMWAIDGLLLVIALPGTAGAIREVLAAARERRALRHGR